ncbi:unnamed protein product [Discula destructiva]
MPMLERTAASLEPCHFQRVLPPTKTPFKSTRRLHTAFWQHGAADIELSSVWQVLIREPLESLNLFPPSHMSKGARSDSLSASTFLLDFLYPQGATSLLRKLSPSALDRYDRPRLYLRGAVPRWFTSSASPSQQSRESDVGNDVDVSATRPGHGESAAREKDTSAESGGEISPLVSESPAQNVADASEQHVHKNAIKDDAFAEDTTARDVQTETSQQMADTPISTKRAEFRDLLLSKGKAKGFKRTWELFHTLNEPEEYRSQFIEYVMKTHSMTYLLVRSLRDGHWRTLWTLWARYPEAHREDVEALDWKTLESCSRLDEGPATRYKYGDQAELWGPQRPVHFSRHKSDTKTMAGLASLIQQINRSAKAATPDLDPEHSRTLLNRFVYPIIQRYYRSLPLHDYTHLPKLFKDPLLYEPFLQHTVMDPKYRKLSDELYKDYRKLPGVKIRGHVMRAMVHHVYKPVDNAEGMEMVLQDLYARFPRLDMNLYRAFMRFYARRNDVKSTQRLFDEYRSHFAAERNFQHSSDTERRDPDFLQLLQLYAVRGELGEARRIFSQAQADFGPKLNIKCWNILLHAHAVAHEYDAAIRVFGVLKQAVTADHYTYSTMMGMSGIRGDLEFTLELYRMAKSEDIAPNAIMVDSVVEAYCQNDKFKDAERIVTITTEKGSFSKSELTLLWNSLLWHHANRRDLKTLNETLNKMTDCTIPYNASTYSNLLRGLAWCRQPHHALFLMEQAITGQAFKPTLDHYVLLMSSFMWSKQPGEMLRTSTILRNLGMTQTGDLLLRVLQALSAWSTKARTKDAELARTYLVSMLRQFRQSVERSQKSVDHLPRRKPAKNSWIEQSLEPTTMRQRTEQASTLIYTFTLMRQSTDVPNILKLWASSSPEASNMQEPPFRLLNALMHTAFYEGRHDEVRELWQRIFDHAVQNSRVSGPSTQREEALPSMRYMLSDPLKTMQRMHGVTEDPDGLRATVMSVLRAGFRLDSKNWNYYVQLLAHLKRWREAFFVCEEHLMPHWRGWARVRAKSTGIPTRIPLDVRRKGQNPALPRPIAHTLLVLSKAYMDLESMTAWSGEAERLLAYIVKHCPASISAVKSAIRTNSALEKQILEQGKPQDRRDRSDEELAEEARAEERSRRRIKAKTRGKEKKEQEEDEMPGSFRDMLGQISFQDDKAGAQVKQAFLEPEVEAQIDGQDAGGKDMVDEIWSDVEEHDGEHWVPQGPGQESAFWSKMEGAETADPEQELRAALVPPAGAEANDDELAALERAVDEADTHTQARSNAQAGSAGAGTGDALRDSVGGGGEDLASNGDEKEK